MHLDVGHQFFDALEGVAGVIVVLSEAVGVLRCPWLARCGRAAPNHVVFWCAARGLPLEPEDRGRAAAVQRVVTAAALCLGMTPMPRALVKTVVEAAVLCQ